MERSSQALVASVVSAVAISFGIAPSLITASRPSAWRGGCIPHRGPRMEAPVSSAFVGCGQFWSMTLRPGPPSRTSRPGPPSRMSSPSRPNRVSLPSPPMSRSSPAPPSSVSTVELAGTWCGVEDVVAVARVDRERVARRIGAGDVHGRRQAADTRLAASAGDFDRVVTVGAGDGHVVDDAVAGAAADGGEVDVVWAHVRAAEVVDGHLVGAAEGVEVDDLDVFGVHRDLAGVTEEREPLSVRREGDFSPPASVEQHRVAALPALDRVAALAGIPAKRVFVVAEAGGVVALAADDRVVVVAALERLGAESAVQRVVAVAGRRSSCGSSR